MAKECGLGGGSEGAGWGPAPHRAGSRRAALEGKHDSNARNQMLGGVRTGGRAADLDIEEHLLGHRAGGLGGKGAHSQASGAGGRQAAALRGRGRAGCGCGGQGPMHARPLAAHAPQHAAAVSCAGRFSTRAAKASPPASGAQRGCRQSAPQRSSGPGSAPPAQAGGRAGGRFGYWVVSLPGAVCRSQRPAGADRNVPIGPSSSPAAHRAGQLRQPEGGGSLQARGVERWSTWHVRRGRTPGVGPQWTA